MECIEDAKLSAQYTLTWHNLSVWTNQIVSAPSFWKKTKYKKVQILSNVNGLVNNGTLVAILGPSGAGKTTLLTSLSCRIKADMVYGDIRLDGQLLTKEIMSKISGFLPQQDFTLDSLTVVEHLYFMASLKMDRRYEKADLFRKVHYLMSNLGLTKCANTYLKNLSGGEMKRVSLGVQVLTDPLILFCDEPTTGLDSYSANSIIKMLQQLTTRGKIIICSIHQPTSEIFQMFDEVILVAEKGFIAYQGQVNQVKEYFTAKLNMVCPDNYNIAEYIVSKISVRNSEDQSQVQKVCTIFKSSDNGICLEHQINLMKTKEKFDQSITDYFPKLISKKSATTWAQFRLLFWRYSLDSIRNSTAHVLNFVSFMYIGVVLSMCYYAYKIKDQKSIQDVQGLIFMMIVEMLYSYSYCAVSAILEDMPILTREINEGLYTVGPYYLCQVILKTTYSIIEPVAYAGLVYYFTDVFQQLLFWEVAFLCSSVCIMATAYGMMLSAIFDSIEMIAVYANVYETIAYLFAGVNLNLNTLSPFFQVTKYLSIFYYGVQSLSILQWSSVDNISCVGSNGVTCITTGKEALEFYGYKTDGLVFDIIMLYLIPIIFHSVAFIVILQRTKYASY